MEKFYCPNCGNLTLIKDGKDYYRCVTCRYPDYDRKEKQFLA